MYKFNTFRFEFFLERKLLFIFQKMVKFNGRNSRNIVFYLKLFGYFEYFNYLVSYILIFFDMNLIQF